MTKMKTKIRDTKDLVMYLQIFAVFVTVFYIYYMFTRFENRTITIKDDFAMGSNKYTKNVVSDENDNVYNVSSQPLLFQFNAAELLSKLQPSKTYSISGYGVRIPWLGLYPQITSVTETQSFL